MGKNIFFEFDEEGVKQRVEQAFFRINVRRVVAGFPNKMIIYVEERYAVYQYSAGGKNYLLDGSLRVLDDKIPSNLPHGLVQLESSLPLFDTAQMEPGWDVIQEYDGEDLLSVLRTVQPFFQRVQFNTLDEAQFRHHFSRISIEYTSPADAGYVLSIKSVVEANNNHYEIEVLNATNDNLEAKLILAWRMVSRYDRLFGLYTVRDMSEVERTSNPRSGPLGLHVMFTPSTGSDLRPRESYR
jgi:hypothetical protein